MKETPKGVKFRIVAGMMKFFYYLGRAFSKIYTFKANYYFTEMSNSFYSGWHFKDFKSCGENLKISAPFYGIGLNYISIGRNFVAGPGLRIEAYEGFLNEKFTPQISIGDNVNINFDCHIGCINRVLIGNNVLIASNVMIIDHAHGEATSAAIENPPMGRSLITKGAVIIEDNVWIGEGCVILPGVKIGVNCIVGSNAVVTNSFDANTVIAGNPARAIKLMQ